MEAETTTEDALCLFPTAHMIITRSTKKDGAFKIPPSKDGDFKKEILIQY